jgi:hypothetical protein
LATARISAISVITEQFSMKNSCAQVSKRVFKDDGSPMASLNGFALPLDCPRTGNTQTLGKRDDWYQKLQYLDPYIKQADEPLP